jgi:hypothetical protein
VSASLPPAWCGRSGSIGILVLVDCGPPASSAGHEEEEGRRGAGRRQCSIRRRRGDPRATAARSDRSSLTPAILLPEALADLHRPFPYSAAHPSLSQSPFLIGVRKDNSSVGSMPHRRRKTNSTSARAERSVRPAHLPTCGPHCCARGAGAFRAAAGAYNI